MVLRLDPGLAAATLAVRLALGTWVDERPPPAVGLDGAFVDCPCVDLAGNGSAWKEELREKGLLTADGRVRTRLGPVPRDYGSGECLPYDEAGRGGPYTSACAGAQPRSWCEDRWCYVDPANCAPKRTLQPSEFLPGLYFSYAACGSIDRFRYTEPTLGDALGPVHVYAQGSDIFSGPRPGVDVLDNAIIEFLGKAARHVNFSEGQVVYRSVSQASLSMFNSSYTACVHDIAIGHLDVCAGAFWDTLQRREMWVPFSSTILNEQVNFYVRRDGKELGFWEMVLKPTRAFSPSLWGLVIAVLVGSSVVIAMLEHRVANGDLDGFTKTGSLLESCNLTLLSFVNAGLSFAPLTGAGKVFSLGLGFFILIATASFTANTASILIAEQHGPEVSDLEDALALGEKVCAPGGIQRTIEAMHPAMEQLGVYGDNGYESYEAGLCNTALLPEFSMKNKHSQGEDCELVAVGTPVLNYATGVFVSEHLRPYIDSALTAKQVDGTWYHLEAALHPEPKCGRVAEESDSMELDVHHMTGTCILLLFSLGVAVLLRALQHVESSEAVRSVEAKAVAVAVRSTEHVSSKQALAAAHALAESALEYIRHHTVNTPVAVAEASGETRLDDGGAAPRQLEVKDEPPDT